MSFVERAGSAWTDGVPDWVAALAEACDASSQREVAQRLNRSASLVSAVLAANYKGSLEAVEELVRGALMGDEVDCPALGPLPTDECAAWRGHARHFSPHNPLRVRMFRACRRCPRFRKTEAADA